jgi:hypothetical protein
MFFFTRLRQDAPCGSTGRTRGAHAAQALAPRERLRCAMATGDRAVAIRAKAGWASVEIKSSCFGAVSLGFATDAPRGSAGSFTHRLRKIYFN